MNSSLVPYEEPINETDINLLRLGAKMITTKDQEIKNLRKDISVIQKNIKNLKEERKIAETKILPIMAKGKLDELTISNGTIKYIEQTKKTPLSKKQMKLILNNFFMENENLECLLTMAEEYSSVELAQERTNLLLKYLDNKCQRKTVILLEGKYS